MRNRIIAVTKLTAKNQTTVPEEIRELLDLSSGDKLVWRTPDGNYATLEKA